MAFVSFCSQCGEVNDFLLCRECGEKKRGSAICHFVQLENCLLYTSKLCNICNEYAIKHRLADAPNYIRIFTNKGHDDVIADISAKMELDVYKRQFHRNKSRENPLLFHQYGICPVFFPIG